MGIIRYSTILTSGFVNCVLIDHTGYNCLYLNVEYIIGNTKGFQIIIETSDDGETFFREQSQLNGVGLTSYDDNVHEKMSLTSGNYQFYAVCSARYVRVSVKGLTDTNYLGSSLKITALSVNKVESSLLVAEGNIISETDISNFPYPTTYEEKKELIDRVEEMVHTVCGDLFYNAELDIYVDGNGKDRIFLPIRPKILEIDSVEVDDVALDTTMYSHDDNSIYLESTDITGIGMSHLISSVYSLFPEGLGNIHVKGHYGWAAAPVTIKRICVILAKYENDPTLYNSIIEGSESLGSYSYSFRGKSYTGVYEADRLIKQFISGKPLLQA